MKQKLFSLFLTLALCFPFASASAGVIIPLKIDDSDNTLETISASQFYAANPVPWSNLSGTPTTLSGYGITDAFDAEFSSLMGLPTTLAGYGITDAQPLDAELTSLANLNWNLGTTDFSVPVYDDVNDSFQRTVVSSFGLTLLDAFDNAAARTTLGLGLLATLEDVDLTANVLGVLPAVHGGAGYDLLSPAPPSGTNLFLDLENRSLVEIDTSSATGDLALTLSNPVAGKTYKFKIAQGTTARALLFPTNTLSSSGESWVSASGSDTTDLVYAEYTGTQWLIGPRIDGLSGLDADLAAYLDALQSADGSVLSSAQQAKLRTIITGLKSRGRWENSRLILASSNYNVASGNTIFALGNLSAENFLKSGTVTWSPSGLSLNGSGETVTAADFLPGGSTLTLVYYGNVFGNATSNAIFDQNAIGGSGPDERAFIVRTDASDADRLNVGLNDDGAGPSWVFTPATVDHIADTNQFFALTFNGGALDVWSDATQIIDTSVASVSTIHNSNRDIAAHRETASGTLVAFLVSTTAWSEADLTWLRGELETLDLN